MRQIMFLPGASGRVDFWKPLSLALRSPLPRIFFSYPGFAGKAEDSDVSGLTDIVNRVISVIDRPTALIAQSMGGVIAIQIAKARPDLVTHLVLSVTSGGLDMASLGARDWRSDYAGDYTFPEWFVNFRSDVSEDFSKITVPTLLLWGDRDPYSPVAVGERLASLIPQAKLHVLTGGDHELASKRANEIAPLVDDYLMR